MIDLVVIYTLNVTILPNCRSKWLDEYANNEGESRHPCLVPWCNVKLDYVIPFVVIVALGEVYRVCIQWVNPSPKNFKFTLSKLFSASNDTIIALSKTLRQRN